MSPASDDQGFAPATSTFNDSEHLRSPLTAIATSPGSLVSSTTSAFASSSIHDSNSDAIPPSLPPPTANPADSGRDSTVYLLPDPPLIGLALDGTHNPGSLSPPSSPIPRSSTAAFSSSDDSIDSYLRTPYAADLVKLHDELVTALENDGYKGLLKLIHELEGRFAPLPNQSKLLASPDIFYDHGVILLAQNDNEVLKALIRGTLPAQYSDPKWRSEHSVEQVSQHHNCPGIYVNFISKASGAEFTKDEFEEILRLLVVYVVSNQYDDDAVKSTKVMNSVINASIRSTESLIMKKNGKSIQRYGILAAKLIDAPGRSSAQDR